VVTVITAFIVALKTGHNTVPALADNVTNDGAGAPKDLVDSLLEENKELKGRLEKYESYGGAIDEGNEWAHLAVKYQRTLYTIYREYANDNPKLKELIKKMFLEEV